MLRTAVVAAVAASTVHAACPNFCNGHGRCVGVSKCECYSAWTGGDCSQRRCAVGSAWADVAIGTDIAHQPAECSARGICARDGACQCEQGYEGPACNRNACPDGCSGHGVCVSMRDNARAMDRGLQVRPYYSYTTPWDADMLHGCLCDPTYTGWNCGARECPRGDDPLSTGQDDEVQLLRCDLDAALYPGSQFTLSFRGATTAPFAATASAPDLQLLLQALPTVGAVSVSFSRGLTFCNRDFASAVPPSGNVVSITFLTAHGDLPSLVVLDARARLLSGVLDNSISIAVDGQSLVYATASGAALALSKRGTKENEPCSRRGRCNRLTGDCQCFPGFGSSDGMGRAGSAGDCGYVAFPVTSCPGAPECSGHGTCAGSPTFTCTCFSSWSGGDCSQRTCPMGPAWFSFPTARDKAHQLMECSNKGQCNRQTGQCECQALFEGAACERMACPSGVLGWRTPCSGHGRCLTMAQLAVEAKVNGDATPFTYGQDPTVVATWDANSVRGCVCDEGYTGYDCSQRSCPFGDDITRAEVDATLLDEQQTLVCELLSSSGGPTFRLRFREAQTAAIPFSATAATVQAALEALSTIDRIRVTFTAPATQACTASPGTTITFAFDTENGDVPPIQIVLDEGSILTGGTYASGLGWSDTQLRFTGGDVASDYRTSLLYVKTAPNGYPATGIRTFELRKGTSGNEECSSRGICNRSTGVCQCFKGFGSSDGSRGPGGRGDCGWREPFQWGVIQQ